MQNSNSAREIQEKLLRNFELFTEYAAKAGVKIKPYREPEDVFNMSYEAALKAHQRFKIT